VLDVGCGDGSIDRLITRQKTGLEIEGIDVLLRPQTHITVNIFDGKHIPHPDKSFDIVMFVDVLHHTDDPLNLLKEALRVSRHGLLIKDHLKEGFLANTTLSFMDWVGNAPHGVRLPYHYWTRQQWDNAFAQLKVRPVNLARIFGIVSRSVELVV
jgi:SAM-dependent methyltransferase